MRVAIVGPIATEDVADYLDASVDSLPPGLGGAPLMGTLIGGLLNRGHEVLAFTTSSTGVPVSRNKWVTGTGERFKIHYCSARPRAFRYSGGYVGRAADFFAVERGALKNAILSESPDVIHAHWSYEFGLAAIATGLPHLVTCHDSPREVLRHMRTLYRLSRYLMAKKCLRSAKILTAVSPYIQSSVEPYACSDVTVVPNPLPNSVFLDGESASVRIANAASPLLLVVINGWGPLKNAETAIRAFSLVRERIPRARLKMYGTDFGSGEAAQRWAINNGLDQGIEFLGRVPHCRLQTELRSADILVHPSLLEGCPMGIAEAMAAGLPVVGGSDSGGVSWVVGPGGLLVDVRSPELIAAAIMSLVLDGSIYKSCASSARRRADELFRLSRVVDQYEGLYLKAMYKD